MVERLAKKVLLIGWDAADWKVAAPLMDEGKMPHLERLVSRGVMGNIATLYPVLSPMLWTSIATGKLAYKHGVHGFAEPNPHGGGVRPISNLSRKCKAIWNILGQNGLRSNIIGWWPSYPAEPIRGVMISNMFQQAHVKYGEHWPLARALVHPPDLLPHVANLRVHPAEIAEEQVLPFVPRLREIPEKERHALAPLIKTLAETATIQAVATAVMQNEPWDFMGVYFDGIDHFCHGFMRYHPPRENWVDEKQFGFYKDVINTAYQFHDMMLGVLLKLAGEDTTVILMSDHGFHSDHLRIQEIPNEPAGAADEHRAFGMFAMSGPGIKQDELIFGTSLLDIAPTILTLFGLPVGQDMDGRPLLQAFVDPPTTPSVPSWEDIPGEDGRHPADTRMDPVEAQEALKQLVALGYIDPVADDKEEAVRASVRELRHNLARNYVFARKIPEAIALFEQLWDENPDEGRFGVKLFECQLTLRQNKAARATLKRLLQEKQRYSKAARVQLKTLSETLKDRKPEDLSQKEIMELRQLRMKSRFNKSTFAFLKGSLLASEGQYERALAVLEKAMNVVPQRRVNLFARMGDCLLRLNRPDEALRRFQEILDIDSTSAEARMGMARAQLRLRNPRLAYRAATAAAGLVYHNPQAHYLRGLALRRLRRPKKAIEAMKVAISQDPFYPRAHRQLESLYRRWKQFDQADEHGRLAEAGQLRIDAIRAGAAPRETHDVTLDRTLEEPARIVEIRGPLAGTVIGPDTIVIVSGLPRSGTSMMMQMLHAGGVNVLTDEERAADSDNPRGYFEYEPAKRQGDPTWIGQARGKAVKLVAQLLSTLPTGPDYRILFMERPLADVVSSQKVMLERLGRDGGKLSDRGLALIYRRQIDQASRSLAAHAGRVSLLEVNYNHALSDPGAIAAQVNELLGGGMNEAAMAAAIDPSLRRQATASGSES